MSTIVYRSGLNQKSYELESRKKHGEIFLVRIDYINGFTQESVFDEHPAFDSKKEANLWIKEKSKESYLQDKLFTDSYLN